MAGRKVFFSIIIPTYNRAEKLNRALASLKKQTCRDFEVIVCDDGSTDHTEAVVERFSESLPVLYVRGENFGGPARPRNNGLRLAKGEWICFLDDDDWWYPQKLEIARKATDNADLIYHDLDIHTPRGKSLRKEKGRRLVPPIFADLMARENCIKNSSACIRKTLAMQVGSFNEDKRIVGVEDYDFWLRASRVTCKFLYIPKSLGIYWKDKENLSVDLAKYIDRINEVYNRHLNFLRGEEKEMALICRDYIIGKMKANMSLYPEALSLFRVSVKAKDLQIKIKSVYLFIITYLKCSIYAIRKLCKERNEGYV
ncbi:MAG: glycosyltransferase [Candidatus Omnitrophica bacterium]|nr:glycosyltransferase [Candidatus Omnitrophota bacterium]